ncbi:hypothetical protein BVI2075_160081 [Burkholderia vietnamiensis]|nr:hypothetical protein BVI2075_160081 [Burkholderia vietnamiensis]CAG9192374.1 hypothetical protein BVI1335_1120011 [Burkholderia vietnamiensis]
MRPWRAATLPRDGRYKRTAAFAADRAAYTGRAGKGRHASDRPAAAGPAAQRDASLHIHGVSR